MSRKSGKRESCPETFGWSKRAESPPTSGWRTATTATATAPAMAVTKRRRSVRTTPRNPPIMLKSTVTPPARSTVWRGVMPRSTPAILMAARVTEAMITTLKKTPR
jgi:hypothetical protein